MPSHLMRLDSFTEANVDAALRLKDIDTKSLCCKVPGIKSSIGSRFEHSTYRSPKASKAYPRGKVDQVEVIDYVIAIRFLNRARLLLQYGSAQSFSSKTLASLLLQAVLSPLALPP